MVILKEKLKNLLVRPGHISETDFIDTLKEAEDTKKSIVDVLVEKELIKDEQLGQLIAQDQGHSFINLRNEKICL